MRLLLLSLLIGFNLAGFAGTNEYVVSKAQYFTFDNNDITETNESTFVSKLTAQLSHAHFIKPHCQHRQIPFARFTGSLPSVRNTGTAIEKNIFVAHECFCKPIQLLLLFPKHYFW